MAYYLVYITEECRKEAESKGCPKSKLDEFKCEIEKNQEIRMFDPGWKYPYRVKSFGPKGAGRLVAKIIEVEQKKLSILIFLAYFKRKDDGKHDDYNLFRKDPYKNGESLFADRYSDDEINKYVEERLKSNPPAQKKDLSAEENNFLYDNSQKDSLDNKYFVYESDDWIRSIKSNGLSDFKSEFLDEIHKIVDNKNCDDAFFKSAETKNGYQLIYLYQKPDTLFLADIISKDKNKEEINRSVEQWGKKLNGNDNITNLSRRSYPEYMLYDEEIWYKIEKDERGNITLSCEETNVLKTMKEDGAYPLFINGRAGSGKSTILQYIFAGCFYDAHKNKIALPAYFTYNQKLLDVAKKNVEDILNTNANFIENNSEIKKDSLLLNNSFFNLNAYLRKLANNIEKFHEKTYVDYRKFCNIWTEFYEKSGKKAKKDYSAQVSWHIIRTYIEGWSMEGNEMNCEDYTELPKDQQTVSDETFKNVYENTWKKYKQHKKDKGLWDDQDLVQYIIKENLAQPQFSGIFCDEAQDFTHAELEVLFRLSIFSDRNFPKHYTDRIPFAFAGDELQTLNPTGFTWDVLKATFTDKFIWSINPDAKTELNFHELRNNYRSRSSIVKFSNSLQLYRMYRFDIRGLCPQKHWWQEEANLSVNYFSTEYFDTVGEKKDNIIQVFWENISKLTDAVFIFPCDNEDEIYDFIKNDKILSKNIDFDKNNTPNRPCMTAISSKGLEFDKVVVYGFGDNETIKDKILLQDEKYEELSESDQLPIKYHINKTYVAVTRAKNMLFIVDSDVGVKNLWKTTKESDLIDKYLNSANGNKTEKVWSLEDLSSYVENDFDVFKNKQTSNEEVAEKLMESGVSEKNPFNLRQAAKLFEKANKPSTANKCSAFAFLFENNNEKAGDEFEKAACFEEAIYSYWLAKNYVKLLNIKEAKKEKIVYTVSNAINNIDNDEILLTTIETLSEKENLGVHYGEHFTPGLCSPILSECINIIIDKIRKRELHKNHPYLVKQIQKIKDKEIKIYDSVIIEMAMEIRDYGVAKEYCEEIEGYSKYSKDFADMAFEREEYKLVESILEKITNRDEKTEKTLNISKSKIKPYPEKVEFLFKLGEYKSVINEFEEHKKTEKLSEKNVSFVVQSLFAEKKDNEAINLFEKIQEDPQIFVTLFEFASKLAEKKLHKRLDICKRIAEISKDSDNYISGIIKEHNDIESIYIALALSMSKKYSGEMEKPISKFLNSECIENFRKIPHKEEYLFDIGNAIEMDKKLIDALAFYEKTEEFFKNNNDNENCSLAASRWIWAKEKQIETDERNKKFSKNPKEFSEWENKIKRERKEVQEKRNWYEIKDIEQYTSSLTWAKIFKFILEYEQEKYDIKFGYSNKKNTEEKTKEIKESAPVPDEFLSENKTNISTENTDISKKSDSNKDIIKYKNCMVEYSPKYKRLTITLEDGGKITVKKDKSGDFDPWRLDSDIEDIV